MSERLQRLVEELLAVSRDAVAAARVEHKSALRTALDRRERLLAEIWGFDTGSSLPEFSNELMAGRLSRIDGIDTNIVDELQQLDTRLLQALNAQLGRLHESENTLTRGRQYMIGMRAFTGLRNGKRFDRTG